jgi:hypothetical protein
MPAQDNVLAQSLGKHINSLGSTVGAFREAANKQNSSIGKIVKDIGGVLSNNKSNMEDLNSTLTTQSSAITNMSSKVDGLSNIFQTSLNVQQNMLSTLRDIKTAISQTESKDKDKSSMGWVDALKGFVSKRAAGLAGLGIGVAGAGALGAGAIANANHPMRGPGQNGPLTNGGGPPLDASRFQDPRTNTDDINEDVLKRYEGKHLPASIRLNNMGAMSLSAPGKNPFVENMPGYVGATPRPSNEGGFYAQYATPVHGVNAASKNLENYGQKGVDTPDAIVAKWTTGKPNPTYSAALQKYLGEGTTGSTKLDLSDPMIRKKILMAKSEVESGAGQPVYKEHVYDRGVQGDFTKVKAGGAQTAATGQGGAPVSKASAGTPPPGPSADGGDDQGGMQQDQSAGSPGLGQQGGAAALAKYNLKDASAIEGMKPDFSSKLSAFLQAAEQAGNPINIKSGYRTEQRQAELYKAAIQKYGSEEAARKWVAPPGQSNHNKGMAADLSFGSEQAKQWAHANANKFGLNFRMAHENWHVEPAGSYGNEGGERNVASQKPGFGNEGGPSQAGVGASFSPMEASMMNRFHGGGGMMGAMGMGGGMGGMPMGGGMGMSSGMMLGGMVGGGRGAAIGGLAEALVGGIGSLFGGGPAGARGVDPRTSALNNDAVMRQSSEDSANQAAIEQQQNSKNNQQTSESQRGQTAMPSNGYNGANDMRVSDNSFFGDLMKSGMFSEQTKNLQFSA